jgi:hypothetical protein
MASLGTTHFVFVDFENRPVDDLGALARHPVVVILFLGQKSRLKKALVEQIETLPFEVRLIKVGVTKKNPADFVLTYHLGAIIARHPGEKYYVISGDDDFSPVITHLQNNHQPISQHPDIASLPFLAKQKPTPSSKPSVAAKPVSTAKAVATAKPVVPPKPVMTLKQTFDEGSIEVIGRLKDPSRRNRPLKEKTLRAHITSSLGKETSDEKVQSIVNHLIADGDLKILAGGKVEYREAKEKIGATS